MPPTAPLSADQLEVVRAWIADGATDACDTETTPSVASFHPDGWEAPAVHGLSAKLQEQDCRSCHGDDFSGGDVGVACSSCHDEYSGYWTADCSFCHGEAEWVPSDAPFYEWIGAPPQDIDDATTGLSFPAHRLHLRSDLHADWNCDLCHAIPSDVFTPGHVFVGDTTPGEADLTFAAPLSPTSYAGGTCEAGCHFGEVSTTDSVACGGCHPTNGQLPDRHGDHLSNGVTCGECHPSADGGDIDPDGKALHVDGSLQVELPPTMAFTAGSPPSCTGTCHGERHAARRWLPD